MNFDDDPFVSTSSDDEVFLESSCSKAMYNVYPILPGHSLVVPKRPVQSVFELDDWEFSDFMFMCRQATEVLCHAFGAKAYNWTLQSGVAAGQTVPHLHMHLIPRSANDLPAAGDWYPLIEENRKSRRTEARRRLSPGEVSEIVARLRKIADHK
jgi:bis(5'-adenosyl)-triphosphatase